MKRSAKFLLGLACLLGGCLLPGCEPEPPSRAELGRIEFDETRVPGADQTYTLPDYILKATPTPEPENTRIDR
ncbi:MAG TPA: hypothetical protein VHC22_15335 [Pirellulales bacterium]|nr:hypothetical protein [Pirellulales bacterium]